MKEKYQPTKEELVELIGMAELLASKFDDMGQSYRAADADTMVYTLRREFDRLCGEEEFERMRNESISD